MKLKTYQATSIDAALKLARIELGEEALFLGAEERPSDGAAAADRRFHATFALSEDADSPAVETDEKAIRRPYWQRAAGAPSSFEAASPPEAPPKRLRASSAMPSVAFDSASQLPPAEPFDRIRREIQELRRELETRIQPQSSALSGGGSWLRYSRLSWLYDRVTTRGVSPNYAAELIAPLEASAEAGAGLAALRDQLRRRVSDAWRIVPSRESKGARVLAFVGPTGSGKTTVVAKAAVRAARRGSPVRLISVDQPRIGAAQTLGIFADLIDAPVSLVEEASDLPAAVREAARGETDAAVLVDTRSYGPAEDEAFSQLVNALAAIDEIETHFVIQPGLHPADLDAESNRYARLRPSATLFTRLDETTAPAAIWNVYRRLGVPISYLSEGPRVPEDLRRATSALLTDWVLPEEFAN